MSGKMIIKIGTGAGYCTHYQFMKLTSYGWLVTVMERLQTEKTALKAFGG